MRKGVTMKYAIMCFVREIGTVGARYTCVAYHCVCFFFFYCYGDHRDLHSFPTRRSSDLRDTSLAVGCDGFLQKPIDAREFAETVEGYLRGRRELSSPDLMGERLRAQSHRIVAHLEEKVAELSHANERLRDLDRARKEFYRNISHELATPMTPIVGSLNLLADEELGTINTPQIKARRAMDDCVRRLRSLIDNLLDVSGLET